VAVQVSWYNIEKVFVVYNSNNPDLEVEFTREEFIKFLQAIKNGELDEAFTQKTASEV